MMDMFELANWLSDFSLPIEEIEGRLFLDRQERGPGGLQIEIGKFKDINEAQYWINIIPISDFIDKILGASYDNNDELNRILDIYAVCWTYQIRAKFGMREFDIQKWFDEDAGDFGLRLLQ